MSKNEIWSDHAPKYKREGGMYAHVDYDSDGKPQKISVAKNQVRLANFKMEGATAVLEPRNIPAAPEPGIEEKEYVMQLPFVQAVKMDV